MRIPRFRAIALLALMAVAPAALAQQRPGPSPAQLEAMKKLDFLIGKWKGSGWAMADPNQRREYTQTEDVQKKAGGSIVLIEGHGTMGDTAIHDALAVVDYDEKSGKYRFRAWQASGPPVDTEVKVGDRTFEWGFESPRGSVRFRMSQPEPDQWLETGEFLREGAWVKFMEMKLQRAN